MLVPIAGQIVLAALPSDAWPAGTETGYYMILRSFSLVCAAVQALGVVLFTIGKSIGPSAPRRQARAGIVLAASFAPDAASLVVQLTF